MSLQETAMIDADRCQVRSDVGFQVLADRTENVISTPNTIVSDLNVKMTDSPIVCAVFTPHQIVCACQSQRAKHSSHASA